MKMSHLVSFYPIKLSYQFRSVMSHLVSFYPIKLSYQFKSVMVSRSSVYYSCFKVLNLGPLFEIFC